MTKHKIPDFDEGAHLSIAELSGWAEAMTNPARIASARSKVGQDTSKILEAIFPRRLAGLNPGDDAQLRAALVALARRSA